MTNVAVKVSWLCLIFIPTKAGMAQNESEKNTGPIGVFAKLNSETELLISLANLADEPIALSMAGENPFYIALKNKDEETKAFPQTKMFSGYISYTKVIAPGSMAVFTLDLNSRDLGIPEDVIRDWDEIKIILSSHPIDAVEEVKGRIRVTNGEGPWLKRSVLGEQLRMDQVFPDKDLTIPKGNQP